MQVTVILTSVEKENTKKLLRQMLTVNKLGMAWQIQLKFRIGGVIPQKNLHRKIHLFLLRGADA